MAGEKFKLNFITNGEGIVDCDEPIGFDKIDITVKQKDKGYGRDVFFGGDDSDKFEFVEFRNHHLDTLFYYYQTFGWESKVQLIIEKDGIDTIIGDFHFQTADTNLIDKFSCKVVQDNDQALLKRRSELNVNVFSDEDIDGEAITPLTTKNVLVKSMPLNKASKWEVSETFDWIFSAAGATVSTEYYALFPSVNLVGYDINDSYTVFSALSSGYNNLSSIENVIKEDYIILKAENNLTNIKILINNLNFNINTAVFNGGDGYVDLRFDIRYGTKYETSTKVTFFNSYLQENQQYSNTEDYVLDIPYLNRGDQVWCYVLFKVRQSNSLGGRFTTYANVPSMDVDMTATSIAYNTITPSIRLYDSVSQVVKSTSKLETSFPFAEFNGEMYNQRLFNGNMLRNLKDKPFNISLDKIEKWLPEINGDFEIQEDRKVFFGRYKDFYTNKEIAVFSDSRFESYGNSMNQKYSINQFSYKYKKYQSQKENEIENSFDISHGESQWSVLNLFAENKKEVSVEFVRDSVLIDEQRRKAFDLSENTATQDDETVFILDTLELTEDLEFEETDFLQHTYQEDTGYLKVTNTGTFSFELLGLAVGEIFEIQKDINEGVYTIKEVNPRYILIDKGLGTKNNDGERITSFKYVVSIQTAPFISWSNEDLTINGLSNTDGYANLKYTIKRNINNHYSEYLSTCNIFAKKPIKNTLYQNNGDLELIYEGVKTVESEDFTPDAAILTPYIHKVEIISDFTSFIELKNKIKSERGYFRFLSAENHLIKGYIKSATFRAEGKFGVITCEVEEKLDNSLINIAVKQGYLSINDEYICGKITYKIKGERVHIMDDDGLLFYHPAFWQKVTINGVNFDSKEKLIDGLNLLK